MHRMFNITPTISEVLLKAVARQMNQDFVGYIHENKDPNDFFAELLK